MKYTKLNLYIILINVLFSLNIARAEFIDFSLGAGLYDQFVKKVQTTRSGETNKMDYLPFLNASTNYKLNDSWSILPEFGFVFPGNTRDENISKLSYWFLVSGAYVYKDFHFRLGTGLFMTFISSDGGTQSLPNGNGTTEFFLPSESVNTMNIITNLGIDYFWMKEFSTKLEASIFNITNSRNKAISYGLSFHYHFQDKLWKN